MDKIYAVVAVGSDDAGDGHARVLGAFKNEADAQSYVRNGMEDYCDWHAGTSIQVDFGKMEIRNEDGSAVCWSIDEVEVQ